MSDTPKQCQELYAEVVSLMSDYKQYLTLAEAEVFLKSVDVNRHKHISKAVEQRLEVGKITSADVEGFYSDYLKELKSDLLIKLSKAKKDN